MRKLLLVLLLAVPGICIEQSKWDSVRTKAVAKTNAEFKDETDSFFGDVCRDFNIDSATAARLVQPVGRWEAVRKEFHPTPAQLRAKADSLEHPERYEPATKGYVDKRIEGVYGDCLSLVDGDKTLNELKSITARGMVEIEIDKERRLWTKILIAENVVLLITLILAVAK